MGLGTYPGIGLADARILRDQWESVKHNGRDPIDVRAEDIAHQQVKLNAYDPILEEAVESCLRLRTH